ncbi:MAG: hypothetical protein Kow0031_31620 [Anaerolineae bacterium]
MVLRGCAKLVNISGQKNGVKTLTSFGFHLAGLNWPCFIDGNTLDEQSLLTRQFNFTSERISPQ